MLKNLQDKVENDLNQIKTDVKSVPELEKKCENLKVTIFLSKIFIIINCIYLLVKARESHQIDG
jgi:hypothetical protein